MGLMRRCLLATESISGLLRPSKLPHAAFTARTAFNAGRPLSTASRLCTPAKTVSALEERIARIPIERFRNFCIVAHVDHGKSTLSDRLLELTGTIEPNGRKQTLDKLAVERERGITVKAQTCSMIYSHKGDDYLLHLVDTPGHVDFRAEVSRSYASCGGGTSVRNAMFASILMQNSSAPRRCLARCSSADRFEFLHGLRFGSSLR